MLTFAQLDEGMGTGPTLFIGGFFDKYAWNKQANHVVRWNGLVMSSLDTGLDDACWSLAAYPQGGRQVLFAGGVFKTAGGQPSPDLARWACPPLPPCGPDCDGSYTLDLFDFLCFVNSVNNEDPAADRDANGTFDLFDFLCYTNQFNAGC